MKYIKSLNEKKPKGAPDFHHSDAPDAEGRFRDLGIKALAAWLIKTRKKDVKKISGSLTQQVVFNRNDDPEYAEKMEKVRREVYKQLGRKDLLDKMDESYNEFFYLDFKKWAHKNRAKINRMSPEEKADFLENEYHKQFGKKHWKDDDLTNVGIELHDQLVKDRIIKESVINEEDSYDDYPAAAKKNAQMAIDWKEKYGRDEVPAGTPVGWARAHQLAKGEKISADTVKRMSAFNRHRKNSKIAPEHKDTPWKDNGYVAWLIWGGDEGVDWAMKKSKEIDAMEESKQMKYIRPLNEAERKFKKGDKIEYKQLFGMGSKQEWTTLTGVVMKVKNKKKSPLGTPAPHQELTLKSGAVVSPYKNHKDIKLAESNQLNEGYWSHYEYDKWTKENGKPKYPKWVKTTLKEIVKGGFMEDHYDAEHNYMVLWLASLENKRRSELYAYDNKGKKEFGKVGYAMYQRFYNDLTGYNMFFMQGALYAMEVSKQIQDRIANGESVEPAYYMMKEYFNNFGMDTKRSRVFNAAYEKLEKWMKDNQIKTL